MPLVSCSQTFTLGRKGSGEHSIAVGLYPISHLKGFSCAASGMLISLNGIIMPACNLEKDDKVMRNVRPTNIANTISHHCSLISRSIQVSCNLSYSTVVLYIGIMKVWGFWPEIITRLIFT